MLAPHAGVHKLLYAEQGDHDARGRGEAARKDEKGGDAGTDYMYMDPSSFCLRACDSFGAIEVKVAGCRWRGVAQNSRRSLSFAIPPPLDCCRRVTGALRRRPTCVHCMRAFLVLALALSVALNIFQGLTRQEVQLCAKATTVAVAPPPGLSSSRHGGGGGGGGTARVGSARALPRANSPKARADDAHGHGQAALVPEPRPTVAKVRSGVANRIAG